MQVDSIKPPFDSRHFRDVLGQYPTGVCVVTAMRTDGRPAGMAVGSFTSVSLDPPLVAFLPDKKSSSWPKIQASGSFCINVLAASQEHVCRALAAKSDNKFDGLIWRPGGSGSPMLDGAVAWIDCDLETVHEAGDHYIVIGRVRHLEATSTELPLLFFRGGYGQFAPLSFATGDADLVNHLRVVDLARASMEEISAELGMECAAAAVIDRESVYLATAGRPHGVRATRVGVRLPFIPPIGICFAAWGTPPVVERWLSGSHSGSPVVADQWHESLARIRARGYAIGMGLAPHTALQQMFSKRVVDTAATSSLDQSMRDVFDGVAPGWLQPDLDPDETYDVRTIMAPVFGPAGRPILQLGLIGLPVVSSGAAIQAYATRLMETAQVVSAAAGA